MVDNRSGSIIKTIFKEGNINILTGKTGSGKTNVVNFFIEKALSYDFNCLSNINYFRTVSDINEAIAGGFLPPNIKYRPIPKKLHVVRKFSDMILILLENKKNIVFLDESGIFISSTNVHSKMVRQMKELSYTIRHLQSAFVLICQSKNSIAPDLRSTLVTYEMRISKARDSEIRKLGIYRSDTDESVSENEVHFSLVDNIGGIPLSRLPWDGFFLPSFSWDIPLTSVYEQLAEFNSVQVRKPENGPRIIMEMMKEVEVKKTNDSLTPTEVKEMARERFREIMTSGKYIKRPNVLSAIAEEFGMSYQWALAACRNIPWE